ncbi:Conserved_hypothetical protein [Hexamita inflata]|uniref:Integrase catalytic domain-containing protein n=1 Tax=Hexamita inflata TaxID=28002 RepID=A0AA86QCQ8_9EUKA|nr:Conserved hypothetical protein [Hexamita inflata]
MTQQKLVFVNQYDSWQTDLLELRDSKFMKEKIRSQFVSIFYNPASHMLHLKLLSNKTPAQTLEHIKDVQKYLDELDLEPDILTVTSDFGNEYKGVFENYLVEHDIVHKVVLFDDFQLAPINSICKYVRGRIQRAIQELDDFTEDQFEKGQVYITQKQLETILNNLIKFHNFEKVIGLYQKVPVKITREEVDDVNAVKQAQNDELNKIYDFDIGDLVNVLLLKEHQKFDKKRERKWSQNSYKIVNKIGSFFEVIPEPFDFKQYVETFKLQRGYPWGIPAYHRKCYQLKFAKKASTKYFSYELENTNFYTFDSIKAAVDQKGNVASVYDALQQTNVNYLIKASTVNTFLKEDSKTTYKIKPSQLKTYDKTDITPIEDNYLFGMALPEGYVPVFLMK